jgi:transcriptional regulator with XRE-family HTH domain
MKMKNLDPIDLEDLRKDFSELSFANLLKAYRNREKFLREEMASLLGISGASYSGLENGKILPTRKRAEEIAKKLGLPSKEFVALAIQDRLQQGVQTNS